MADVKWIKITTDIFDNRKIRQIECLPEGDAIIVIWMKLLILSGNINDDGLIYFTKEIPYTEQMLASHFNRPLTTVQFALKTFEQFGMIEVIDNMLRISNWEKYQNAEGMEKIREQTRMRVARHRERKMLLQSEESNVNVTLPNATDKNRKDIEEDNNNSCVITEKSHESLDDFFESVWNLYPIKKGKGQVSKTKKQTLQKIGFDELERCIKRFIADMEENRPDRKFWMNGSTFFNSGYIDYLDCNCSTAKNDKVENQENVNEPVINLWDE